MYIDNGSILNDNFLAICESTFKNKLLFTYIANLINLYDIFKSENNFIFLFIINV